MRTREKSSLGNFHIQPQAQYWLSPTASGVTTNRFVFSKYPKTVNLPPLNFSFQENPEFMLWRMGVAPVRYVCKTKYGCSESGVDIVTQLFKLCFPPLRTIIDGLALGSSRVTTCLSRLSAVAQPCSKLSGSLMNKKRLSGFSASQSALAGIHQPQITDQSHANEGCGCHSAPSRAMFL